MRENIFKYVDSFLVGLSAWAILSVVLGFLGFVHPVLFLTFILGAGWYWTHAQSENVSAQALKPLLFGIGGIVLVLGFVFFFIQGGFDLSADVAPVFAAQSIGTSIPASYPDVPGIPFLYPAGLPVLISQFAWVGFPLHLLAWKLGVLGILLMLLALARWADKIHPHAGVWITVPLLFVGLRSPFVSLLTGEYPLLLGLGLGLSAGLVGKRGLSVLLLGAAFVMHPYAGLVSIIAHGLLAQLSLVEWVKRGMGMVLLGLPVVVLQLLPVLGSSNESALVWPTISTFMGMVSLIGLIPVLVGVGIAVIALQKKNITKMLQENRVAVGLIGAGVLGFGLASLVPAFVVGGKLIYLAGFGFVLLAAKQLEKIIPREKTSVALGLILLLILGVWITSGSMGDYVNGTKSSLREAQFSFEFGKTIEPGDRVLFIAHGHGKMAEYANTLPQDFVSTHYFTYVLYQIVKTPATQKIQEDAFFFRKMVADQCASCVGDWDVEYVVVDTRIFPRLDEYTIISEKDGFVVYQT